MKTLLTSNSHSYHFREFHREQLSIENSMRDLDSAVGRLDNILMSVYVIVAALIIAVTLVSRYSHRCQANLQSAFFRRHNWLLWSQEREL